ncbi:MAG TPA: aldehyde dehydrogenase family protein [Kofleriaceae bacterium]|nr:aldehyde dehydrogenase family protein [Kofleriaceae bacterium]
MTGTTATGRASAGKGVTSPASATRWAPASFTTSSAARPEPGEATAIAPDGSTARTLTDRKLASRADLDQAYRSAAVAQKTWAQVNPYERRAVLEKALAFLDKHEGDITDLIIEELGGTRLKAMFEIGLVRNIIKEAATYPLRMTGEIMPSVVDGKENRLYRVPVGVVGVISPFNFPLFLSMRSVATALGAGNGVVLKPHDDTPSTGGTLVARLFEDCGLPRGLLNVVVASIDTPDEAVRIANHSAFGLSGAIHTKDVELGAELAKQIDSGAIHINDGTINDDPIVAFGGEKASGFGRLNGRWAFEEFTTLKWISVQHTRRHFPFEPS